MIGVSQSEELKLKIQLAESGLTDVAKRFWNHPRLEELFPEYLFKLHCSIRTSVPLMETALERSRSRADDCAVAARLVPYFAQHIREEAHHDEWLLDDMELLGMDRQRVLSRVPAADVAAMIGAQYYWINHAHPVALLAYLAVVEGDPITVEALDGIVARTAIPQEGLRTFYKHAHLDIKHGADIWLLIDELPLERYHVALLGVSAMLNIHQITRMIENVVGPADKHTSV